MKNEKKEMTIDVYDPEGEYVCSHSGSKENMEVTKYRLECLDYTVKIKEEEEDD